jgi:hypothetical protein
VFTKLLSYVYPVPRPVIKSLDEVSCLLGVALKYDFVIAIEALKGMLVSPRYLKESPLRVYAIASNFDVSVFFFSCLFLFCSQKNLLIDVLLNYDSWKRKPRSHHGLH